MLALFGTLAASCGKKENTDTPKPSNDMAAPKPDSMSNGYAYTVSTASNNGQPGVEVTKNSGTATNASFALTNTARDTLYRYNVSWGTTSTGGTAATSGTGLYQWTQGPDNGWPIYWYPKFKTASGSWTNYDGVTVTSSNTGGSASFTSSSTSTANITVQITAGGGGPH